MSADHVATLAEAIGRVTDGQLVALGGSTDAYRPLALAHELVRQRRTGLSLTGWAAGVDIDLLVAAGVADRVSVPGWHGKGSEKIGDEAAYFRFLAAASGLPYLPISTTGQHDEIVASPLGDGGQAIARAQRPDVLLLHAHAVGLDGTVLSYQHREAFERDRALTRASTTVIVSAEQFVSNLTIERHRDSVLVPGEAVSAVVLAPFGSHPSPLPGLYEVDEEALDALRTLVTQGADAVRAAVSEHPDHWGYLDATGIGRLIFTATDRRHQEESA